MPVSPEAYDRVKPFDIFGDERDYKVTAAMRYVLDQVKGKEPGTEWLEIYDYQTMKFINGALSKDLGDVAPLAHDKLYLEYDFPDLEELIPALAEAVNKGKTLEELEYSALVEKYYKPGLHSEARLMSLRSNQR